MNWKTRLYETAATYNATVVWLRGRKRFADDRFWVDAPKGYVWCCHGWHTVLSQWRNAVGPGWRKWAVQVAITTMAEGVLACQKRGCGICENDKTESEAKSGAAPPGELHDPGEIRIDAYFESSGENQ